MAQLIPLGAYVIVKRLDAEKVSRGGIIIPEVSQEKPAKGVVIMSGPGTMLPSGRLEPTGVKTGDLVWFGKFSGTDIEVNEERLLVLRAADILCIEEQSQESQEAA